MGQRPSRFSLGWLAQTGESDRAAVALQKLLSTRYEGALPVGNAPLTAALLRLDPMFDPLRNDPRFQTLVVSPRSEKRLTSTRSYKRGSFTQQRVRCPHIPLVRLTVARSNELLPQPKETFAALPSGDRCLGHPKVKLFALERSPNVPHATNIAQFTQTHAGYLCYAFISCVRRLQHMLA